MAAKNSYSVQSLLQKLKNPDADLRFMALQDLINEATQPTFSIDDSTEHQLVEAVISLLVDPNGEVKSSAVKTLATLTPSVNPSRIRSIIDKLVALTNSTDEGVRDIASLGLKMVVAEVQPGSTLATTCCKDLVPEVLNQLTQDASSAELLIDSLGLLADILARFDTTVRTMPQLQQKILQASVPLLGHSRPAVRKRTVATIASLIPTTSSTSPLFPTLLSDTLLPSLSASNSSSSSPCDKLLTSISLISAIARTSPAQLGPHVSTLIPLVLSAIRSSTSRNDEQEQVEIKEGGLTCLESLTIHCSKQLKTGPPGLVAEIVELAKDMLKFDPNFAGGDEDEEDGDQEMQVEGDADDEDDLDQDDFEDEYDDEDDTSWRVRRSAAKLLSSLIQTRPDLLSTFIKSVSPTLISRFGDREETVKVEVWTTQIVLLKVTRDQTGAVAIIAPSGTIDGVGGASPRSGLKRKRSDENMVDGDSNGPLGLLNAQAPKIVRSIVNQLTSKSLSTRQTGFALLHELISVLSRGLETQIPLVVTRIEAALKTSDNTGLSGAATQLKIQVLSLLSLFFETHHPKTYTDELSRIVPLIVSAISDRFNKIASQAFVTASSLIKALRPISSSTATSSTLPVNLTPQIVEYLTSIYQATMQRLQGPDADEEVKGKGIQTLGTLLYHAGDYAAGDLSTALSFLRDRLKIEVQRIVAVQTVGLVASSPVLSKNEQEFDRFVLESLSEVSTLLRKVHRPLKVAAFETIDQLLVKVVRGVPPETCSNLVQDLQPLLTDHDVNLLPHALHTTARLLKAEPNAARQEIDQQGGLLVKVLQLVESPLVQGPSLEGLLEFFEAYLESGADGKRLVQALVESATDKSANQGIQQLITTSRCVGLIVKKSSGDQLGSEVVRDNEQVLKSSKPSTASLVLALLTLGEIGRVTDFSSHASAFNLIVEHLGAGAEDVRRSAAFAAGNVAVGNTHKFLPTVLEIIQTDDKKRYLALQALKEVIIHSSPEALASLSDSLWAPLFEHYDNEEESTRNVAADCIGHLTTSNPARYLPQLQARLASESAHERATVIAALRFTFTNDSTSYDELLAPIIVEFFKLMKDSDLGVRRLTLSSLNSAAHNKPHLVRDHLSTLLPELYAQSIVNKDLIRIVEMGPFKHKVDDGLDIRKAAYECMHSIFETCFQEIDVEPFLARVLAGLNDEEEIKKICYILIVKLAQASPDIVAIHLDETVPPFTEPFNFVMKDNSTKQDAERSIEQQKSITRCVAVLGRLATREVAPLFSEFLATKIVQGSMSSEYKEALRTSQAVSMELD
ncbi:uncharacterized protein JCM15063_001621 [Sporobolomyces koalae]|uniref:uncharacterized protein n=1 Tax=Sporobolomyces koalae TaxID=500713 RepID=UPI003178D1FD